MERKKLAPRQRKCFVQWLGIPESECPPHHYRLLDIPLFEDKSGVIREALRKRRELIASLATPDDKKDLAAIEKVFVSVEQLLLNPAKKYHYDEHVRQVLATKSPAPAAQDLAEARSQTVAAPQPRNTTADKTQPERAQPESAQPAHSQPEHLQPANATADAATQRRSSEGEPRAPEQSPPSPISGDEEAGDGVKQTSDSDQSALRSIKSPLVIGLLVSNVLLVVLMLSILVMLILPKSEPEPAVLNEPAVVADETANPDELAAKLEQPVIPSPEVGPAEPVTPDRPSTEMTAHVVAQPLPAKDSDAVVIRLSLSPEETTTEPFAGLAAEFDLPEIPPVPTEASESTTPGKLAAHAVKGLSLELDSSAADLAGLHEFQVRKASEGDEESRRWQVLAVPAENQPGKESQLGHFFVDENKQLRFFWEMNPPFARAAQLANALLVLKSNDQVHTVQLQRAKHLGRFPTEIVRSPQPVSLEVGDLPDPRTLVLQLLPLRGFNARPDGQQDVKEQFREDDEFNDLKARQDEIRVNAEQAFVGQVADAFGYDPNDFENQTTPNAQPEADDKKNAAGGDKGAVDLRPDNSHEMDVDAEGRLRLEIRFTRDEAGKYEVAINPQIKTSTSGPTRYVRADLDRIVTDIKKLQLTINKSIIAFSNATQGLLRDQPLFAMRVTQRDAMVKRAQSSPTGAAGILNQITPLNKEIGNLERNINLCVATRNRMGKNIPKSYDALVEMVSAARVAGELHNRGEVEFHLIGISSRGRVKLLSADGQPEVARADVVLMPFSVPGQWLRLDTGHRYSLGGDNDGGPMTRVHVFDPTQRPLNGDWVRDGQKVTIRTNIGQEQYLLHEDVVMKSNVASLFKSFN